MAAKETFKDWGSHFQTPLHVCEYMCSFLPNQQQYVLEPTPGQGNLVAALCRKGHVVEAPEDFKNLKRRRFDYAVMNPPFTPMKEGYRFLYEVMNMTDNIIALMPYLAIINGERRTNDIMRFGLKSITHLPRSTFKGSRVQCCILEMKRGYTGITEFKLLSNA